MIFAFLGILSGILFVIGDIPYVRDTFKGVTKPHRVTWGIVTLMNVIGFANQYASGATNSLWIFVAATIMTGLIFLGSLKNGVGGTTTTDILCLVIGLVGVALWIVFDSPIYSILASIIADVAALTPSFIKAKKNPESETKISWLIGAVSSLLAGISVGRLDWQLLLLPVVAVLLQGYMVYILYVEAPNRIRKVAKYVH